MLSAEREGHLGDEAGVPLEQLVAELAARREVSTHRAAKPSVRRSRRGVLFVDLSTEEG